MTEEPLYSFSCPVCQAELSLPLSQAGISGPCPYCRQTITAPIPQPGTAPVAQKQGNPHGGKRAKPAPVRMDSAPVPQAQARTHHAGARGAVVTKEDKDEPEEEPGARRASRLMGLIGALAAIGAGAAGVFAWQMLGNKDATRDSSSTTVAGQAGPSAATSRPGVEPAPGKTEPEPEPDQKSPGTTAAEISPALPPAVANAGNNPGPGPATDGTGAVAKADEALKDPTAPPAEGDAQTTGPAPGAAMATGTPDPAGPAPAEGGGKVVSSPGAAAHAPAPAADTVPGVAAMDSGTASPAGESVPAAPPAAMTEEKPYERQVPPPNPEDPAIILREPREALLAFLSAKDWQTRLKYSLRPEQIRAEMEAYYNKDKENKDGPVDAKIDYVTSDFTEDTRTPMWFFHVLTDQGAPIPVALEQTKSGIRVDWRGFIEGYDRRLAKFCAKPGPGRGDFYVAASRAHWFGGKVGDGEGDSQACFKLYPPTADDHFLTLVDTRTPLWEEKFVATGRAAWNVQSRMIVTLEWAKSGSTEYLRLVDIKADSWRADSRDSAPKSPPGTPAGPAAKPE